MTRRPSIALVLSAALATLAACGGEPAPAEGTPSASGTPTAPVGAPALGAAPATGRVCTGDSHTCVLRPNGSVVCAGRNRDGQLGDGTAQDRLTFVPVAGLTNAIDLDCAYDHTCAARTDGHVVCWGRGVEGQLGRAGAVVQAPIEVPGLADAVEVSTGRGFSCARRTSGAVSCWGAGDEGQLGQGATTGSPTPVEVVGLADAAEIDSGYAHTCARHASGAVACWGASSSGATGTGDTTRATRPVEVAGIAGATAIGAGGHHSCAVTGAGLSCWGANDNGQIGNGQEEEHIVAHPFTVPGVTGVTALALGAQRTCVATASDARCWGYDNFTAHLLGVESANVRNVVTPTAVTGLTDAVSLASGNDFSCAIRRTGALSCWGSASDGQTGEGERNAHPARDVVPNVLTLAPAASVAPTFAASTPVGTVAAHLAIGSSHVCTVLADGHVRCFGENGDGQLGNGSTEAASASDAAPVPGITDAVLVAAFQSTSCAVRSNGAVACWGALADHTLPGWPTSSSLPLPIDGFTDVVDLALGGGTMCAVQRAGTVSCLGEGRTGQLGNGATAASATPVAVQGIDDAVHVASVGNTFCALRRAGTVQCWGSDTSGECGNGAAACGATPVAVEGITHASALDGGGRTFCAVDAEHVRCWGNGDHGQLADGHSGSGAKSESPVAVDGVAHARGVGVGVTSLCATTAEGEAYCWGANTFGTSGADDASSDHAHDPEGSPVAVHRSADPAVAAFAPFDSVDCGSNFCCGAHRDGHASCWGSTPLGGSGGLLGITSTRSPHPIAATGVTLPVAAP